MTDPTKLNLNAEEPMLITTDVLPAGDVLPDAATRLAHLLAQLRARREEGHPDDFPMLSAFRTVAAERLAEADDPSLDIFAAEKIRAEVDEALAGARPVLRADEGDLERLTGTEWQAIALTNDPVTLFRFGGWPSRIDYNDEGAPIVQRLTPDRMRYELARRARWVRGKKQVSAPPPMDGVRDMLASPDAPLPHLRRIVEVPVLGPNGELASAPGYHEATASYYAPADGLVIPDVPESPTADEVVAARTLLMDELLGEFPFVGEAERAHAIALLLLPFVRDLIDGPTPLHLIEKPAPGTGATLLADMLALPAIGRPLPAMTEGRDEDEWRKRVTAMLLASPSHVLIDNLRRRLDSAAVSAALTTPIWQDRVLGASEIRSIPVRCVWMATGNNPSLSDELTRRSVRIRLDAQKERPQLRSGFRHPDLRAWATDRRGELIAAALVLCRAWISRGRPSGGGPLLGSYEAWSKVMGGILAAANVPGFLGNLSEFYDASEDEGASWRALVEAWAERYGEDPVKTADLLELAGDLFDLGSGSERSRTTRLGHLLKSARDRRYGAWRIAAAGRSGGSASYRLRPD